MLCVVGCVFSLLAMTSHCFATTSIFTVLFLGKAFGMVAINGTFVFHGPFMSFLSHGRIEIFMWIFFQYILLLLILLLRKPFSGFLC